MANNNESGTGEIDETTRVVVAAKEEVKKEIKAANDSSNPDQEKRRLGEKIREELERTKLAAQEAVSDEVEARARGRELLKKEEGKKALRALTKAVEAVRQGIDPSYISKTKEGAAVLQKIAQERIDFTPSTASAIEYYFGGICSNSGEIEWASFFFIFNFSLTSSFDIPISAAAFSIACAIFSAAIGLTCLSSENFLTASSLIFPDDGSINLISPNK